MLTKVTHSMQSFNHATKQINISCDTNKQKPSPAEIQMGKTNNETTPWVLWKGNENNSYIFSITIIIYLASEKERKTNMKGKYLNIFNGASQWFPTHKMHYENEWKTDDEYGQNWIIETICIWEYSAICRIHHIHDVFMHGGRG